MKDKFKTNIVNLIKRMDYHTEQLNRAQNSDDEEVRQRFHDARLHLMKNIHSYEDFKAFTKALDAAFYRLRKSGIDEKGVAVIRAVRRLLKEVEPGTWFSEKEKKEDE